MIDVKDIVERFEYELQEPDLYAAFIDEQVIAEQHATAPEHAFEKFCEYFRNKKSSLYKYAWLSAIHAVAGDNYYDAQKQASTKRILRDDIVRELIVQGLELDKIVVFRYGITIIRHEGLYVAIWDDTEANSSPYPKAYVSIQDTLLTASTAPTAGHAIDIANVDLAPLDDLVHILLHPQIIWEDEDFRRSIEDLYANKIRDWYDYYMSEEALKKAHAYGLPKRFEKLLTPACDPATPPDKHLRTVIEDVWNDDICKMRILGLPVNESLLPDYERCKPILWEIYKSSSIVHAIDKLKGAGAWSVDTLRKELASRNITVYQTRMYADPWKSAEMADGFKMEKCDVEIVVKPYENCSISAVDSEPGWAFELRTDNVKTLHTSPLKGKSPKALVRSLAELDESLSLPETRRHFDEVLSKSIKSYLKSMTTQQAKYGTDYVSHYICPRSQY